MNEMVVNSSTERIWRERERGIYVERENVSGIWERGGSNEVQVEW